MSFFFNSRKWQTTAIDNRDEDRDDGDEDEDSKDEVWINDYKLIFNGHKNLSGSWDINGAK